MTPPAILIATPHGRNDLLEQRVRNRLPEHQVVRLRAKQELAAEKLKQIRPDFVFFPHWSWPIPEEIHSQFECVIFHMTDLPYGRGGSPLQNLIADRKSTRLNSSHSQISYAVFCLKKKNKRHTRPDIPFR